MFTTQSVLCIGDALFDCIATNDNAHLLGLVLGQPGGAPAPANVATALLVGCMGDDADGDEIVALLLRDTNVDVTLLQ
jgi:sugar/nucleoside kinase (ribokinase family)